MVPRMELEEDWESSSVENNYKRKLLPSMGGKVIGKAL